MFPGDSVSLEPGWGWSRNCTDAHWVFLMEYFPSPAENPPQCGYNAHPGSRIHSGFWVWCCCLALLIKHPDPLLTHHWEPSQVVASLLRSIPKPHKPYDFKHCTSMCPGKTSPPCADLTPVCSMEQMNPNEGTVVPEVGMGWKDLALRLPKGGSWEGNNYTKPLPSSSQILLLFVVPLLCCF